MRYYQAHRTRNKTRLRFITEKFHDILYLIYEKYTEICDPRVIQEISITTTVVDLYWISRESLQLWDMIRQVIKAILSEKLWRDAARSREMNLTSPTPLSSSSPPLRDTKRPARNGGRWLCKFVFWQISFPHGRETVFVRQTRMTFFFFIDYCAPTAFIFGTPDDLDITARG
ncbi:hypothetical protein PUN28_019281 [Cardiocondyla obscurior]|uniref:Uncharacterized protein n=1 Tax=Cardiocondyla obscurior TaxID=286306 RepID=A0AAW2EBK3_9HYME